ncbi:MAG: hypothetical protein H0W66_09455 [Chthoniobacterales bacterium]|nr:hypothetical protein [Chthoniobacterales bacterium]
MDTATAVIWAAVAGAIITDGAAAADTIKAGAIIATIDANFAGCCFHRSIAPMKADTGDADGRAERRGLSGFWQSDAGQPSPISTAIRIRSEWFLAPSFCFSIEVVLATVL